MLAVGRGSSVAVVTTFDPLSLFACAYSVRHPHYIIVNILRQLGLSATAPTGRKRVLLVIDWPEHGGVRARDAVSLTGEDLWEFRCEVRRLLAQDLRRQGYTWGGRKGNTRKKAVLAA